MIITAAIVVVAVITLATVFTLYRSQLGSKSTTSGPFTTSSSISSTSSSLSSSTSPSYSSSTSSSGTGSCATSVSSTPFAFMLQAGSQSPAFLCVQLYYYNQTSTLTLNPLNEIAILGMKTYPNGTGAMFSAISNFTITTSLTSITIGGPSSQNEGATVTYSITPNKGTSGRFALNLGWLLPGKIECNEEFILLAGNGSPDYTYAGHCSMPTGGSSGSPYPPGYVFTEVTGATNSTR